MQSHAAPALGNASNSKLVVFDENKSDAGPSEPKLEAWKAPPTSKAKENEQKPGVWCDVKV